MERIEEFTRNGKNFVYIDVSNIKKNEDFIKIIDIIKPLIAKYPENSVYTIVNVENILFDTETKGIAAECFTHNNPYVKCGAIIGLDGIKKMMVNAIVKLSGRKNMLFLYATKEQAIERLLQQGEFRFNKDFIP
jgi:hypothetical protein